MGSSTSTLKTFTWTVEYKGTLQKFCAIAETRAEAIVQILAILEKIDAIELVVIPIYAVLGDVRRQMQLPDESVDPIQEAQRQTELHEREIKLKQRLNQLLEGIPATFLWEKNCVNPVEYNSHLLVEPQNHPRPFCRLCSLKELIETVEPIVQDVKGSVVFVGSLQD